MSRGWIAVADEAVATDEAVGFWIATAVEYNDKEAGPRGRRRPQKGAR